VQRAGRKNWNLGEESLDLSPSYGGGYDKAPASASWLNALCCSVSGFGGGDTSRSLAGAARRDAGRAAGH
jgi:hypothetical protein